MLKTISSVWLSGHAVSKNGKRWDSFGFGSLLKYIFLSKTHYCFRVKLQFDLLTKHVKKVIIDLSFIYTNFKSCNSQNFENLKSGLKQNLVEKNEKVISQDSE